MNNEEKPPEQAPDSGTPQAAEPPADDQAESPQSPAQEPAQEEAEGQEKTPAPAEAPTDEPAAPAEAPDTPAANYDGLDSGLAWLGAEPFAPPCPVGYQPPPAAAEAPRELSEDELHLRRRRIHGRFQARRKEAHTQKPWYRKIPVGALSMVPILTVLLVVTILYPPWRGGSYFPAAKETLDHALLDAEPLANPDEILQQLGVKDRTPKVWRVLPGNILATRGFEANARLVFAMPPNLANANYRMACDICLADRDPASWGVAITLAPSVGIILQAHPSRRGKDYVAGRRSGLTLVGHQHTIKPRTWNHVEVIVSEARVTYTFNGKALKAAPPRPPAPEKIELTTYNTHLLVRNWRIEPLD